MDMVGPLPVTPEGFKYILTVCDYGTRYPEAFPMKGTTSKDVVTALMELFSRMGIPEEILTDRGSNFVSELTLELYTMLGIKSVKTSAYHPQTDGMVERFNGTLKTGLRKYLEEYGGHWNQALPYLLFAYRETPHSTTGFSPFELLLGRTPKGPMDVLAKQWTGEGSKAGTDAVTFLTNVYQRMERAAEHATAFEQKSKTTMAKYYDRGARLTTFQVGDLVLLLKPSVSQKLQARWRGPYTVVRRISPTTYQVKKDRLATKTYTYHVNMLQTYHSPTAVCLMATEQEKEIPSWEEPSHDPVRPLINSDLSESQQAQLRKVVEKYPDVWNVEPGRTTLAEMSIDTGEATPISLPPYSIPHARKQAARDEVRAMLQAGVIEPSRSPWAAPLILVQKKDGKLRPVIDFRKLNRVTVPDPYPMPRTEELVPRPPSLPPST